MFFVGKVLDLWEEIYISLELVNPSPVFAGL
jgi:hypothetical protein